MPINIRPPTKENLDHFFTLLMGKCWYDFDFTMCNECAGDCEECLPKIAYNSNPDHLANPLPVIRWMEEHMAGELDRYLINSRYDCCMNYISETHIFMYQLDLRNLVRWLIENPSWGEKECDRCLGLGRIKYYMDTCPVCLGTGKIIHPALQYAIVGKEEAT